MTCPQINGEHSQRNASNLVSARDQHVDILPCDMASSLVNGDKQTEVPTIGKMVCSHNALSHGGEGANVSRPGV